MGLVDLRTNLKSLRYGKDRVGGGNSNQPYVTTKIPDSFSKIGKTGGPDFLLRGGALLPKIVVNDVSRLAQMFFDFKSPAGPLFIAKQNVLSLTNVNSEVGYIPYKQDEGVTSILSAIGQFIKNSIPLNQGIYTPLGTLAQAAGNAVGLHTNKQGLNPFANFSLGGKTTQGSPNGNGPLGLPTYLNTISTGGDEGNKSRLFGFLDKQNEQYTDPTNLYSYSGGPGAILGVGKTKIKMESDQRTGVNNPRTRNLIELNTAGPKYGSNKLVRSVPSYENIVFNLQNPNNPFPLSETRIADFQPSITYTGPNKNLSPTINDESLSDKINNDKLYRIGASAAFYRNTALFETQDNKSYFINPFLSHFNSSGTSVYNSIYNNSLDPYSLETKVDNVGFKSGVLGGASRQVWTQQQIEQQLPVSKGGKIGNFSKPFVGPDVPSSLDYTLDAKNRIEQRVNLGDPGRRGNRSSYTVGLRNLNNTDPSVELNSYYNRALDQINALPIYQSSSPTTDTVKNDLVKFRIGVISNKNPDIKTYIHFRAFIDNMSDNYSAEWQPQKYMGRGENFYKYQGFDRKISLSWTVAAQSKQELIPMYQKLNYLASVCAPDYSPQGYMGGNLISLTIGGWCYEQVGIMTGLNLDVPTESPWEIAIPDGLNPGEAQDGSGISSDASVKELPMIIRVTGFNFIPIHNFVPKVQNNYFPDKNGVGLDGGGTFVGEYGPEQYIGLATTGGQNNYSGGKGNPNLNYIPPRPGEVSVSTLTPVGIQPL